MEFTDFCQRFNNIEEKNPGKIDCNCPICDDQEKRNGRHFHIEQAPDGKILVNCNHEPDDRNHAIQAIEAVGLTKNDLFPDTEQSKNKEVARYTYTDADGNPVAIKFRYTDGSGKKSFSWRNPKTRKPYRPKETPLYNLSLLKDSERIFFAEGEKDADTLCKLELTGTTTPDGARTVNGKWYDFWNTYLENKEIYILTDNDDKGKSHGLFIAKNVIEQAKFVKIIPANMIDPDVKEKGDITDILHARGEANTLERLSRAMSEAKEVTKESLSDDQDKPSIVKEVSEIEAEIHKFAWYPYIPEGEISFIVAQQGTGKSTFVSRLISEFSKNDGNLIDRKAKDGKTLIVTEEDAGVWKPRLQYSGCDLTQVKIIQGRDLDPAPNYFTHDEIRQALDDDPKIKYIIYDTYTYFSNVDESKRKDVKKELNEILSFIKEKNLTAIFVAHQPKGVKIGLDIGDRIIGSQAIAGTTRSIIYITKDWTDETGCRRICFNAKNNYATPGHAFTFKIESHKTGKYDYDGNELTVGIAKLISYSELTPKDLYQHEKEQVSLQKRKTPAEDFGNSRAISNTIRKIARENEEVILDYKTLKGLILEHTGTYLLDMNPKAFGSLLKEISEDLRPKFKIATELKNIKTSKVALFWNGREESFDCSKNTAGLKIGRSEGYKPDETPETPEQQFENMN